ncbi:hypothetical protein BSPWISOXPB_3938 [uncultured Gammaproteobacteria bacterium]|nr:hypothetical protein BSPWISOXPB_3938 [uncultured Gammaproteobacteria bacterium]
MMSDKGANTLGEIAATLADGEGLQLTRDLPAIVFKNHKQL